MANNTIKPIANNIVNAIMALFDTIPFEPNVL